MNKKNKAITSIIATTSLILTIIIIYVSFQSWYLNNTEKFTKKFDQIDPTDIIFEKIESNTFYIKNNGKADLNITNIEIEGIVCNVNSEVNGLNLTIVDLNSCTQGMDVGIKEITVFSNQIVITRKKEYTGKYTGNLISSFQIGTTCPIGYTKFYALESTNDTHAESPTSNLYTYSLCIKHIKTYPLINSCAASAFERIVYLDNTTNAHAFTNKSAPFGPVSTWNDICLGSNDANIVSFDINYSTSDLGSLNFTCIGSIEIDDSLGGHMGDCSGFSTKIWARANP